MKNDENKVKTTAKATCPDDEMLIVITHLGYIERIPLAKLQSQVHDDVGVKAFHTRDDDFVERVYQASMLSTLLLVTNMGLCYWLKVCDIPDYTTCPNGCAIRDLIKIGTDDFVRTLICVRDFYDEKFLCSHYVVFCTKNGTVKKTRLMDYFYQRNGIVRPCNKGNKAINISEGDALVNVVMTNGENELLLASCEGSAIRFNESQIRQMGRIATGVRGMWLKNENDEIVGMTCIKSVNKDTVMIVCENGYGIRSEVEDYRLSWRGNTGLKTLSVTEKTGKVVAITTVTENDDLIIINKSGIAIRLKTKDVCIKKRGTQGVKLTDMFPTNDNIISVLKVDTSV